jgi:hypothetical protein
VPKTPAFGREVFQHKIKPLGSGVGYDDLYIMNTQSGTQWDGFRHVRPCPSFLFLNASYISITNTSIVRPPQHKMLLQRRSSTFRPPIQYSQTKLTKLMQKGHSRRHRRPLPNNPLQHPPLGNPLHCRPRNPPRLSALRANPFNPIRPLHEPRNLARRPNRLRRVPGPRHPARVRRRRHQTRRHPPRPLGVRPAVQRAFTR